MATTYTTNVGLPEPATADTNWGVTLNAMISALDVQSSLGSLCVSLAENPSSTLNVKISAGTFVKSDNTVSTYAGTTQGMTASSTNFIYLTDAGVLTVSTSA